MKTYNVKLNFSSEQDKNHINEVLEIHSKVWNYISEFVHEKQIKLNDTIVHEQTYFKTREKFPETPSQLVIKARQSVVSTYKSIKTNIKQGNIEEENVKYPCVMKNLAIRLDKRLYRIKNNTIKITTCHKPVICSFKVYKKLEKMLSTYNFCDPLIFKKGKEFWLAMTFDTPEPIYNQNSCIGIDLGLKRIAVTSEGKMIKGSKYLARKRQIRYLKSQLKKKKKETRRKSDSARKHLRKLKNKERNYNKNFVHHVVNELLKTNSNTIVLENLSKIKKKDRGKSFNSRLSQIPFRMLRDILSYKAQTLGKRVETVNPYRTSKNDYRNIEPGVRKGCRYYTSDGKVFDADLNASINIAFKYLEVMEKFSVDGEKLPVSFIEPLDGTNKLFGQGVCQPPNCLVLAARQATLL